MKKIYLFLILIFAILFLYNVIPLSSKNGGETFVEAESDEAESEILAEIPKPPLSVIRNTIGLLQEKLSPSLLKITIKAENLSSKIIGTAFDLNFNPEIVEFIEYRHGEFFERGGAPIYISQLSQKSSTIVTGITLKRGDSLQKGAGDLIYFYFNVLANGNPKFEFKNQAVATLVDGERRDIEDIQWGVK